MKSNELKSSELRIGNFIENTDSQMASYMVVNADVIKQNEHSMYASLEPIPLTKEWLLKFGFKHQYKTIEDQDFFEIIIDCNFKLYVSLNKMKVSICKKYVGNVYSKKIDYVHQLQNLYFALTGEELTLKP